MSNLTLNTKTYTGAGLVNGLVSWIERSLGIASGFSVTRSSLRTDPEKGGKVRGKWDIDMPIVATESSACSCAGDVLRTADANISFRLDKRLTLAERTDFALRLKDLVASAQFQASIINLEQQV